MTLELSGSKEDYLESILILREQKQRVRVTDIARFLGVSRPSVVAAVTYLEDRSFVEHERYGDVRLTPKGERKARGIYARHVAIRRFLHEFLGLDREVAERDACRMEHLLAPETVSRMQKFLEFIESHEGNPPPWLARFRDFAGED